MTVAAPPSGQTVQACLVALGGTPFALDVRAAKEIVVFDHCTPVPQGPPHLLGVGNLRGSVIPVLDIQPLLGLPPRRVSGRTTVLVGSWAMQQVAIAVDRVLRLERVVEVVPFTDGARNAYGEYALGLLPQPDGFVTLLNMPRLVETLKPTTPRRSDAGPGTGP